MDRNTKTSEGEGRVIFLHKRGPLLFMVKLGTRPKVGTGNVTVSRVTVADPQGL